MSDDRLTEIVQRAVETDRRLERIDEDCHEIEDYDRLLRSDRRARLAVERALRSDGGPGSYAVQLPDGTLVVRCEDADGVAILPPDRVRRIAAPEDDDPRDPELFDLGLLREICAAIARYRGPGRGYPVHTEGGEWGTLDVETTDRWVATGRDGTTLLPGAIIV